MFSNAKVHRAVHLLLVPVIVPVIVIALCAGARTEAVSAGAYPVLDGAVCTVNANAPNGRMRVVPSADVPPGANVASSFAVEDNWAVVVDTVPSVGTEYSFTAMPTSGLPMFTVEETSEDGALLSLCGWSLGVGDDGKKIIRCSSAHNHGLYTLVVTDVATDADSNATVVVGMSVEYTQSGSALETQAGSGLEVFSPEVAVFALDCVPPVDVNLVDVRSVYTPRSDVMRIDGTFESLPLTLLTTVRRNGRDADGVFGADNVTLIDGGVTAANWVVQYSTHSNLQKLYHFESVPGFPRLVVGLPIDPDAYRETGEFVPQGHHGSGSPNETISYEEFPFDEGSEFYLCIWASDPALDGDIADEDGVLACGNSDDMEITFFTPSAVAYDGDTGESVVSRIRVLVVESGDALLAEVTGALDGYPAMVLSDVLRAPEGGTDESSYVFDTRTAYADPTGEAGAVYPNMVRDAPDRIRGSLPVASRDGDTC